MIEAIIVTATLAIALLGVLAAHVTAARMDAVNRETAAAAQAVRAKLEDVVSSDVLQVPALFDALAANDPGGAGTAPGTEFSVAGASPDSAGRTGTVLLPVDAAGNVREDLDIPEIGMPRDLNGDGLRDALDHRADFRVLPVAVVFRWRGASGDRQLRLGTVLCR